MSPLPFPFSTMRLRVAWLNKHLGQSGGGDFQEETRSVPCKIGSNVFGKTPQTTLLCRKPLFNPITERSIVIPDP